MKSVRFLLRMILCIGALLQPVSGSCGDSLKKADAQKILIFVTSGDKEVITKVAVPYALNSKKQGWWDEVRFLIWGPSALLMAEDPELNEMLRELAGAGVETQSCLWCAEQYDVEDKLADLGVDVKYMGRPVTEMLQSGWKVLTF